ncbi:MAG: MFS transporter [Betaproteobacteria bacterium]|nr:MFS transporter [Betaproteobacteria bacterium]
MFACFGVIMGSWAGRIPALRDDLQLSVGELSIVLLCSGTGAASSSALSSALSSAFSPHLLPNFRGRMSQRTKIGIAGLVLLLLLVMIGLAPNLPLMMLAVFLLGASASTFDIGMNAAAAREENLQARSLMARLHACACAGGLGGVMLGSGMAWLQFSPIRHFSLLTLPCALLLWLGVRGLSADVASNPPVTKKPLFVLPRGDIALLGMLGLLAAMTEGSIANWSGVFMTDQLGASMSFAPMSLAAFSAMMLLSRFRGDRLKAAVGARRLICGGALVAGIGIYLAVFANAALTAVTGFAIAGLGMALVFPFVFSAAGRQGATAITGVATMTYAGSVIGPPLLGGIAQWLGLQAALGFTGLLSLLIAGIGMRVQLLR